jgi:hypothetical protein
MWATFWSYLPKINSEIPQKSFVVSSILPKSFEKSLPPKNRKWCVDNFLNSLGNKSPATHKPGCGQNRPWVGACCQCPDGDLKIWWWNFRGSLGGGLWSPPPSKALASAEFVLQSSAGKVSNRHRRQSCLTLPRNWQTSLWSCTGKLGMESSQSLEIQENPV